MKYAFLFLILCCGLGASSPEKLPPLASDVVIDAAQSAPLSAIEKEMEWNAPFSPFRVYGNVHYVGPKGVSAWLITGNQGHILIDGAIAQSAPQIIANIKALGFDIKDVKYLLNSHAHFDHAGGLAGLKRASGAKMLASAADKPFLEDGDIGHGPSGGMKFPPVRVDRVVRDGARVRLGNIEMVAHLTPGHSPGCTSWSMKVRAGNAPPKAAFFHCSATVAGQSLVPEAYPGMVNAFRQTFKKLKAQKADIFLGNHNNFFDLEEKRARQLAGDDAAFVNPGELAEFNATLETAFERQLKKERELGNRQ
jgi:metallo-beta-lactamase class B